MSVFVILCMGIGLVRRSCLPAGCRLPQIQQALRQAPKPKLTLPPAPKLQPSVKKQKVSPLKSEKADGGLKQNGGTTASEHEPPPGKLSAPEALPTATFGKKAPTAATDRSAEVPLAMRTVDIVSCCVFHNTQAMIQ